MRMKKIAAILTAAGILSAMGSPVYAADNSEAVAGHATVCIEKFTLGQGYILEPVSVPFYAEETGADLLERAYGKVNFNDGKGVGTYVDNVNDPRDHVLAIPGFITDAAAAANIEIDDLRETDGVLSSQDFCGMSGWIYFVNNEVPLFTLNEYIPEDGDVLRLAFTVYGYGSDMGVDTSYMAEWGGTEPLCPTVNRDKLTAKMAEVGPEIGVYGVYIRSIKTASNLLSTQDEMDKALLELAYVADGGYSMGDVDRNGKVNIFDAVAVAKSTVGTRELDEKEQVLADMNGDFKISIFDAVDIARYTVNSYVKE